jgi:AraC-like DNA-binding protein
MSETITLCTALLGLFLAIPLFVMVRERSTNIWLGLFVFSVSLSAVADYCAISGLYVRYPWLWGIFDWPIVSIGAFYYCYVRSLVGLGNGRRQLLHAVPPALFLLTLARFWWFSSVEGSPRSPTPSASHEFHWLLLGFQALACAYAVAVLYRLRQYRAALRERYSSTTNRDLAWLQWLNFAVGGLLILWIPIAQFNNRWLWLFDIARVGLLYTFGWYGMRQSVVFLAPKLERENALSSSTESAAPASLSAPEPARERRSGGGKYLRSGMTDSAQQLIGLRLEQRMVANRDFLQADITLAELAENIGTSPQLLSEYLNHALGQSFFDYINSFRVAEVQRLMSDVKHESATLIELAFAAGFNSKSTFNAAFRKISGTTPTGWRAQHNCMSTSPL